MCKAIQTYSTFTHLNLKEYKQLILKHIQRERLGHGRTWCSPDQIKGGSGGLKIPLQT